MNIQINTTPDKTMRSAFMKFFDDLCSFLVHFIPVIVAYLLGVFTALESCDKKWQKELVERKLATYEVSVDGTTKFVWLSN
jgi:hypothetical protein